MSAGRRSLEYNELSKPVSKLMPFDIDLITNSNDNNLLAVGKRNTGDLWLYRYFQNDKDRIQSSWFKWKIPGYLLYYTIMEDTMYLVTYDFNQSVTSGKVVALYMLDLKDELATVFCGLVPTMTTR